MARALFALILCCSPYFTGQNAPSFKSPQEAGDFMQAYYMHPQPDRIPALIEALSKSGVMGVPSAQPGTIGFFGELFATNAQQTEAWTKIISKQDEQTKEVLNKALALSRSGGVLRLGGHTPSLNDEYWGAFSASGNPKIIGKLAEQLHYFDEREDLNLFMTGASAKWSLASMSRAQPEVRKALESAKTNSDKRTQQLIDDVINRGVDTVRQETAEIIQQQRKLKKWQ